MSKIIGIDLGTTNSCVAVMEDGKPRVIENDEGARTTPSMVAFTEENVCLVGTPAKRQAATNSIGTIFAAKRLIGKRFEDGAIENFKDLVPYSIVESENGDAWVEIRGQKYPPQQISALIIQKMKETAENFLTETVSEAVITVPAHFNDAQRQATKDAGKIAGINVKRIINEPTAAALAYGLGKSMNKTIAVYDLGGGTFDISILRIEDDYFEVLATDGDTDLGGEDFDNKLVEFLFNVHEKEKGDDLRGLVDSESLHRLKEASEKAKIELSNILQTDIRLPFLITEPEPINLEIQISRADFDNQVRDLVEKTKKPCEKALKAADLNATQIDEVILVGGMTRVPLVQSVVKEIFKKEPMKSVNPDEAVALGAAIQANLLGESTLAERDSVNVSIALQDVTPLSLGTSTIGDIFSPIINKNTRIPIKKSGKYTTVEDDQTTVEFPIYQGDREIGSENKLLGDCCLEEIEPKPKGKPDLEVIFEIDIDGILNVTAKDCDSGNEQKVQVKHVGGLTNEQIDQMREEARIHAESDKQRKKLAEVKNSARDTIYDSNKIVKEGNVTEENIETIKSEIFYLESILPTDDISTIEEKTHNLRDIIFKLKRQKH